MAVIYEKKFNGTGALLDTMLILEPREALIYPFDFGDDWTEIRMSAALSIVSITGNNEYVKAGYSEDLPNGVPSNNYYMGFIGWTGNIQEFYGVPASNGAINGTVFVGSCADPYKPQGTFVVRATDQSFELEDGSIHYKNFIGVISDSGNYSGVFVNTTNACPYFPSYSAVSSPNANTGFATLNSLAMKYDSSSNKIRFAFINAFSTQNQRTITDPSILKTRQMAGGSAYPLITWTGDGTYYTHNFTAGGIPQRKPTAAIIYSPFFECKLRISSLIVERYS